MERRDMSNKKQVGTIFPTTTTEVLNYLKKNNSWCSSISLHATISHSSTVNGNTTITDMAFIRDNDRCQWKGTSTLKTNENEIIKEGCHVKYIIMNGEQYLL